MLSGRKTRCLYALNLVQRLRLTLCAVAVLFSSIVHAQSSSDDLARRHFDSGVAYLEESDYDNSLKAFQKAYELSKRPEILVNIATVHERRGELSAAVTALRGYLEAAPNAELAETIRLRVQNLEKRAQNQMKPPEPEAAPAAPPPEPAAAPPAPPPPKAPTREPPRSPTSGPNRWPAFVALGAGGLMAGGALVTGLLAQDEHATAKDRCSPSCTDEQVASGRTLAITSTVLTGAAVVGLGLGVALLLLAPPEPETVERKRTPRIDLALSPQGAAASAAWRF